MQFFLYFTIFIKDSALVSPYFTKYTLHSRYLHTLLFIQF